MRNLINVELEWIVPHRAAVAADSFIPYPGSYPDGIQLDKIGVTGHSNGARAANLSIREDNMAEEPLIDSVLLVANDAMYTTSENEPLYTGDVFFQGISNIYGIWLFAIVVIIPVGAIVSRKLYKLTGNPYLGGIIWGLLVPMIMASNTLTQI